MFVDFKGQPYSHLHLHKLVTKTLINIKYVMTQTSLPIKKNIPTNPQTLTPP